MTRRFMFTLVATLSLASTAASAGMLDKLGDAGHNTLSDNTASAAAEGASGGSALLSQLATGSFNLGSAQNVAGLLGYCQKQGFAGDQTTAIRDQLLTKLGGESAVSQGDAYQRGLAGVLNSDQDHAFSLAGVRDQVGKRACHLVASKAASTFLGS